MRWLYLMDGTDAHAQALAGLGPHRTGKACLYLKSLDGLDRRTLTAVLAASVQAMRARQPVLGAGVQAKRAARAADAGKAAPRRARKAT